MRGTAPEDQPRRRRAAAVGVALAAGAVAACSGSQRVLAPASEQAGEIARLTILLTAIAGVVLAGVLAALGLSVRRGLERARRSPDSDVSPATERRLTRTVGAAAAATTLIRFVHLLLSVRTGRALAAGGGEPLTVEVTGHQWWWEVVYHDPVPQRWLTTANELHIPVGRPVRVITHSRDVIHSFWAPNLHGKQDLIPGHGNALVIRADTAGVWDGQCAEFCGLEHALMRLVVVAEPPAKFNVWYASQLAPAAEPADSSARRGRDVFLAGDCVMCHTITGTPAGSRVGPDLTHLASRPTIAAGTLPNTRGHLAGWIVDPQRIKPGVKMPPNPLAPADLNALLDYLGSLR